MVLWILPPTISAGNLEGQHELSAYQQTPVNDRDATQSTKVTLRMVTADRRL
jgi:hypothetical protein